MQHDLLTNHCYSFISKHRCPTLLLTLSLVGYKVNRVKSSLARMQKRCSSPHGQVAWCAPFAFVPFLFIYPVHRR